jgi:hypothetical protein
MCICMLHQICYCINSTLKIIYKLFVSQVVLPQRMLHFNIRIYFVSIFQWSMTIGTQWIILGHSPPVHFARDIFRICISYQRFFPSILSLSVQFDYISRRISYLLTSSQTVSACKPPHIQNFIENPFIV